MQTSDGIAVGDFPLPSTETDSRLLHLEKRIHCIADIHSRQYYIDVVESFDASDLPPEPDAYDWRPTKREWEKSVQAWRYALRAMHNEAHGSSGKGAGKQASMLPPPPPPPLAACIRVTDLEEFRQNLHAQTHPHGFDPQRATYPHGFDPKLLEADDAATAHAAYIAWCNCTATPF